MIKNHFKNLVWGAVSAIFVTIVLFVIGIIIHRRQFGKDRLNDFEKLGVSFGAPPPKLISQVASGRRYISLWAISDKFHIPSSFGEDDIFIRNPFEGELDGVFELCEGKEIHLHIKQPSAVVLEDRSKGAIAYVLREAGSFKYCIIIPDGW